MGPEVLTTPDGFKLYVYRAPEKKYKATVVFIHHMWGSHRTTGRHYRYLNEKGFDCVTFDLLYGSEARKFQWHPLLFYFYRGVFYIWTRQIRSILNTLEGEKILYGFSGPSLSAFWSAHGRNDIVKVICDGGPFHNIYENTRNFFYHELGVKRPWLNKIVAFIGSAIWGLRPLNQLHKVLRMWPKSIPILSIRGVRDEIVKIDSIREVFLPHPQLQLSILELPDGKHLDGLRDFEKPYTKALWPFITDGLEEIGGPSASL